MTVSYESAGKMADRIEEEMKRIGMWQGKPLEPERYKCKEAFCMDTMSFEQWLQFILIPRVREIIEAKGKFPAGSAVAVMAVRNFDGLDDAEKLISLLAEFDGMFNRELDG